MNRTQRRARRTKGGTSSLRDALAVSDQLAIWLEASPLYAKQQPLPPELAARAARNLRILGADLGVVRDDLFAGAAVGDAYALEVLEHLGDDPYWSVR